MLQRILIAGSIALFVITIIEVGILAFSQFNPDKTKPKVNRDLSVSPTTKPSPAINQGVFLSIMPNSALTSSKLSNIYEGEILSIEYPGTENDRYDAKIVLKGKGSIPTSVFFTKDMVSNTKVFLQEIADNLPIGFSDLKIGDIVTIELISSLDTTTRRYTHFVSGLIYKQKINN